MIQEEPAIQIGLDVITHRHHPNRMPLPEGGRLRARRSKLVTPAVVVIQPKVILQGVGPYDIIVPLSDAKYDAAGGIFPARHRLEPDRDVDLAIRTGGRHDHVEGVLHSALDKYPCATRGILHLFHAPLPVHNLPALNTARLEIEPLPWCPLGYCECGSVCHPTEIAVLPRQSRGPEPPH